MRWNSVLIMVKSILHLIDEMDKCVNMVKSILHLKNPVLILKENPKEVKDYPSLVNAIPDLESFEML